MAAPFHHEPEPPATSGPTAPGYDIERRMSDVLPHYNSPDLQPVQLAEVYARLTATAVARAGWLGARLAEACEREGIAALVGDKYAVTTVSNGAGMPESLERVPVSEEIRALARLEAEERDRAERLTREAVKLGIEAKRVDVMRSYGRTVAEVTRQMADELGLDWADPAVRRVAQRAVLGARAALGYDARSREAVGPRLSDEERERVLGGVMPPTLPG